MKGVALLATLTTKAIGGVNMDVTKVGKAQGVNKGY